MRVRVNLWVGEDLLACVRSTAAPSPAVQVVVTSQICTSQPSASIITNVCGDVGVASRSICRIGDRAPLSATTSPHFEHMALVVVRRRIS